MKKILVLGVGAQGSAAAKKLDKEPDVGEIICADYDKKAVDNIVGQLTKAKGMIVDANDVESIINAAQGVDLLINGLALQFAGNVLEAALAVGANYQDYAGTDKLYKVWEESEESRKYETPEFDSIDTLHWWESYMAMFKLYSPRFKEKGKLAVFGTGSAPGLICAATREAMKYLDTCDTIYNFVWEGAIAKRFQPFWWSPVTALSDMCEASVAIQDGKIVNTEPFGLPVVRQYDYMDEPITFREHTHDEPFQYAFNTEEYFKGCKNAYFKYAGAGIDFAMPLYQAGLLSREVEEIKGQKVAPFDLVLSHIPPAPKYEDEIREFIDEGLAFDSGCMVVEAYGKKDGKDVLVEVHVNSPGFVESFEREKITSEMYLTGQSGYLFSKLFLNGDFDQTGLISSDMLSFKQVDKFFEYAAELGITIDVVVKEI